MTRLHKVSVNCSAGRIAFCVLTDRLASDLFPPLKVQPVKNRLLSLPPVWDSLENNPPAQGERRESCKLMVQITIHKCTSTSQSSYQGVATHDCGRCERILMRSQGMRGTGAKARVIVCLTHNKRSIFTIPKELQHLHPLETLGGIEGYRTTGTEISLAV